MPKKPTILVTPARGERCYDRRFSQQKRGSFRAKRARGWWTMGAGRAIREVVPLARSILPAWLVGKPNPCPAETLLRDVRRI